MVDRFLQSDEVCGSIPVETSASVADAAVPSGSDTTDGRDEGTHLVDDWGLSGATDCKSGRHASGMG